MLIHVQQAMEKFANVHARIGAPLHLDVNNLAVGEVSLPPGCLARHHEAELAPVTDHVVAAAPVGIARVVDRFCRVLPGPAEERGHGKTAGPFFPPFQPFTDRQLTGAPSLVRLFEYLLGTTSSGRAAGHQLSLQS